MVFDIYGIKNGKDFFLGLEESWNLTTWNQERIVHGFEYCLGAWQLLIHLWILRHVIQQADLRELSTLNILILIGTISSLQVLPSF